MLSISAAKAYYSWVPRVELGFPGVCTGIVLFHRGARGFGPLSHAWLSSSRGSEPDGERGPE